MRRYRGIGRFFADEWQQALSNSGIFYTPTASDLMTLDELNAIKKTLTDLIAFWTIQADPTVNTAWEAQANASAIVGLEQEKLNTVNSIIASKSTSGAPTLSIEYTSTDTETVEDGKSWLPVILIGAAAIYFFTRKKRRA